MRSGRGFKVFVYWVIMLGYLVGLFYVWHKFKQELNEQRNQQKQYEVK